MLVYMHELALTVSYSLAQNQGAIIGISVSVVVAVIIATILLFFACKRYRSRHAVSRSPTAASIRTSSGPLNRASGTAADSRIRGPLDDEDDYVHQPYGGILAALALDRAEDVTVQPAPPSDPSSSHGHDQVLMTERPTSDLQRNVTFASATSGHLSGSSHSDSKSLLAHGSSSSHTSHDRALYKRPAQPSPEVPPSSYRRTSTDIAANKRGLFVETEPAERPGPSSSVHSPSSLLNPGPSSPSQPDRPGFRISSPSPPGTIKSAPWHGQGWPTPLDPSPAMSDDSIDPMISDNLLDPKLIRRPGLMQQESWRSLHDNLDYSRPIGAFATLDEGERSKSTLHLEEHG